MSREIIEITDRIIREYGTEAPLVIPILQAVQKEFNYLPAEALDRICSTTDISPSRIYSVSTFYSQFRHSPVGKHMISVCVGTACHVKGALQVYDAFRRELKIDGQSDTDADGLFTVSKVACLGCCTIAPVVQIDNTTYGHVTTDRIGEIISDFKSVSNQTTVAERRSDENTKLQTGEIRIGLGSCCVASGSAEVKNELDKVLSDNKINVDVKSVGCVGICNQVPMIEILKPEKEPVIYTRIEAKDIRKIVLSNFEPQGFFTKIKSRINTFSDQVSAENLPVGINRYSSSMRETPVSEFLNGQVNIATENRGVLKPLDIDEYINLGGFNALKKCINNLSPEEIVGIISTSGLRGRGGAGFPSGTKWKLVRDTAAEEKYVICNGDEGDPGAFMDRMLLESYPFRIIEGMIIAAVAVGAKKGIFYVRAEYKLAVSQITKALEICYKKGILGDSVMQSGFTFDISLFEGAGAFICGEETALIASMEGERGFPRQRPPYPAVSGFNASPTLINNTETFALVSWIINQGADRFAGIGTKGSKGTKVFALAGKVKRGGLIEVPMGTTVRQIVEIIGGGVADGRSFKAVQIGGPSGGCIPAEMADIPVDFESLKEAGAMMGSGGLIVLDDSDCMVDIARYFLSFTQDQSCGKCTFCRIGTHSMLEILTRICSGNGTANDIIQLEELAHKTQKGSLCGLGKTAPNPVLSTLLYYKNEYLAHIEGKCPTGKCQEMIEYRVEEGCIGCTKCAQRCPSAAIELRPYEKHEIITALCIKCDICRQVCPTGAIVKK